MITTGAALIRYVQDFDPLDTDYETDTTQVDLPGGGRKYIKVTLSDGSSTEFLIEMTYEALEKLRTAFGAMGTNCKGADRFSWLEDHLRGPALQQFKNIVARNYRNQNQKTHDSYVELRRRIITALSDHVNPGNRVRTLLMQEIKFFKCKTTDGTGRVEKPTRVLVRLERIRAMAGEYMHHSQGAVFLSDNDFKNSFWDIFPKSMKNWLTKDQNINPFDANNPLDAGVTSPATLRNQVKSTRASESRVMTTITATTKVDTREAKRAAIIGATTTGTTAEDISRTARLQGTRNTSTTGLTATLIPAVGRTLTQRQRRSSTTTRPMARILFIGIFMKHT